MIAARVWSTPPSPVTRLRDVALRTAGNHDGDRQTAPGALACMIRILIRGERACADPHFCGQVHHGQRFVITSVVRV